MNKYGLIGYPLSHSFSEKYFSEKFEKEGINDCEYNLYPLKKMEDLLALFKNEPDLKGLNVTIPYKETIIPFLDELEEVAKEIGAVNCIKIEASDKRQESKTENPKTRLVGYNTDIYGFKESLKPFLKNTHEKALILGTGGASKAVYYVLKNIGIECFFITRDKSKLKNIANCQLPTANFLSYEDINEMVMNTFKLIVNTSPVGMYPNVQSAPQIPYEYITPEHFLYDLVYNPEVTLFLKKGKEKGALTLNGLPMLKMQAEKAWEIWKS